MGTYTIWEYPLAGTFNEEVEMPRGAELLTVQMQGDQAHLWALVDPSLPKVLRDIRIYGTGQPDVDIFHTYVGTLQFRSGMYVFHVFDAGEKECPPTIA